MSGCAVFNIIPAENSSTVLKDFLRKSLDMLAVANYNMPC